MIIETIRLSQDAKEQLSRLKRHTGISQWNILCRWGLLRSLAEPTDPPNIKVAADSNVEMAWRVFAGQYAGLYEAIVIERHRRSGRRVDDRGDLAEFFRQHLHRGIAHLAGDKTNRTIASFVGQAISTGPRHSELPR